MMAWEEKQTAVMKAHEEKKAAPTKKAKKESNSNITVCRQQYQMHYHNGPQEMPIVVPMNDEMLAIIGPLREG